jgi:CheY-like chemotaxis protein
MPKTLLLADDSVTIQKVVGISFANEDVTLLTVDNGDDAIARTREARPDIVLADVVMPGMSGYEVCEAIKSDPELGNTPVLLLTGTFEAFDEERAARAGADGHITKPFEAQSLVDQVNARLAQVAAPAPEPAPDSADSSPPEETVSLENSLGLQAAPEPAPDSGEAFDFFDDEITEPRGFPAPASGAETVIVSDDLDLDGETEDAFAFEVSDEPSTSSPSSPEPEIAAPVEMMDLLAEPEMGQDSTVAILPEDDALSSVLTETPATTPILGEGDLAQYAPAEPAAISGAPVEDLSSSLPDEPLPTHAMQETLAHETAPNEPTEAISRAPDETVIFSDLGTDSLGDPAFGDAIDSSDAAPAADFADDPLDEVGVNDLAVEAVLDPTGGRNFDVSSSDLGDPIAETAAAEAEPSSPWPAEPAALAEAELLSEPAEAEPSSPWPVEPPALAEAELLSEPAEAEPSSSWPAEPPALPETEFLSEPAPEDLPEPAPDPLATPTEDAPAPSATSAPDLSPLAREQLHEALERIAWDAFSDVTEQIVKEALERIERVAWEVIPQMAEALIREEIRKLKGEED